MMSLADQENSLRRLGSWLIMKLNDVSLRGTERSIFLYVIGNGKSAEISWDENGKLWVQYWDSLEEGASPTSDRTFDDIEQAKTAIVSNLTKQFK